MRNETDSKQPIVALEEHYKQILELLGEDSNRTGLERTPQRVAQAMCELTRGYDEDPSAELINSSFKEEYQRMVIVKDIRFFSMCEHHLLPFYGKVHVAYIPNQLVTGLSKIARVVDIFSHRLQVQERFTREIKECIVKGLQPQGVIVFVEAEHMCMQMRGEEKQHATITTIDYCGVFDDIEQRKEFISMIQKH